MEAVILLYWVYCWRIIQQCMLIVDNFHVKCRYTYTHFFHLLLKVVLVSCYQIVRMKNMCICFSKVGLVSCYQIVGMPKNSFGIRNTQYIIALSVHKQPSVFNTRYKVVWLAQLFLRLQITLLQSYFKKLNKNTRKNQKVNVFV